MLFRSLALALRERRRVEHDEIVATPLVARGHRGLGALQKIERILANDIHRELIPGSVARDQRRGVLADLHSLHRRRAGLRACERERALVCETVQHTALRGERGDERVVAHLVEVKAGLLSAQKIDLELDTRALDRKSTRLNSSHRT